MLPGLRLLILAASIGALTSADLSGQQPDQDAGQTSFRGLTEVRTRVDVLWDLEVTMRGGVTREEFESSLRDGFEASLRGGGLTVIDSAVLRVECSVSLTLEEGRTLGVHVQRTVRLTHATSREGTDAPSVAWSAGRGTQLASSDLSGGELGQDCALDFLDEWRRANPRG